MNARYLPLDPRIKSFEGEAGRFSRTLSHTTGRKKEVSPAACVNSKPTTPIKYTELLACPGPSMWPAPAVRVQERPKHLVEVVLGNTTYPAQLIDKHVLISRSFWRHLG